MILQLAVSVTLGCENFMLTISVPHTKKCCMSEVIVLPDTIIMCYSVPMCDYWMAIANIEKSKNSFELIKCLSTPKVLWLFKDQEFFSQESDLVVVLPNEWESKAVLWKAADHLFIIFHQVLRFIYMKGSERGRKSKQARERYFLSLGILLKCLQQARGGPDWSQEPGTPCWSPIRVAGP